MKNSWDSIEVRDEEDDDTPVSSAWGSIPVEGGSPSVVDNMSYRPTGPLISTPYGAVASYRQEKAGKKIKGGKHDGRALTPDQEAVYQQVAEETGDAAATDAAFLSMLSESDKAEAERREQRKELYAESHPVLGALSDPQTGVGVVDNVVGTVGFGARAVDRAANRIVDNLSATVARIGGYHEIADEIAQAQKSRDEVETFLNEDSPLSKVVGKHIAGLSGGVATSIAEGTMLGGVGKAAGVANTAYKALAFVSGSFGLNAMNRGIEEVRANGGTNSEALLHGAARFGIEAAGTFALGAIASKLGLHTAETLLSSTSDDVVRAAASTPMSSANPGAFIAHVGRLVNRSNPARVAASAAAEVGEETVIDVLNISEELRAGTSEYLDRDRYPDADSVMQGITDRLTDTAIAAGIGGTSGPVAGLISDVAYGMTYNIRHQKDITNGYNRAVIDFLTGDNTAGDNEVRSDAYNLSYNTAMSDMRRKAALADTAGPSSTSPSQRVGTTVVAKVAENIPGDDVKSASRESTAMARMDQLHTDLVRERLEKAKENPHKYNPAKTLDEAAATDYAGVRPQTEGGLVSEIGLGAFYGGLAGFAFAGNPVLGAAVGAAYMSAHRLSSRYQYVAAIDSTIGEKLLQNASTLSAKGMRAAQVLVGGSRRVPGLVQHYLGEIHEPRSRAMAAIPKVSKEDFRAEALSDADYMDINPDVRAGYYRVTRLLEGRNDGSPVSKNLSDYVAHTQDMQNLTGAISQNVLRTVQTTPEANREDRAAGLDGYTDDQLLKAFKDLYPQLKGPKKTKPRKTGKDRALGEERNALDREPRLTEKKRSWLIDKIAQRRHFTATPDGHIAIRRSTDGLLDIFRSEDGDLRKEALVESLAVMNGLEKVQIRQQMNGIKGLARARTDRTEIPRILQEFPDWIEVGGQRIDLFVRDPEEYLTTVSEGWAKDSANTEVFGQGLKLKNQNNPEGKNLAEQARDTLYEEGADQRLVDMAWAANTGWSARDPYIAPNLGGKIGSQLAGLVRSIQLAGSFVQQPIDIVANTVAHHGVREGAYTAKVLAKEVAKDAINGVINLAVTQKRTSELTEQAYRLGLLVENAANWEFDTSDVGGALSSSSRWVQNALISATKASWTKEQFMKAPYYATMVSRMMDGKGTDLDIAYMVDNMAYNPGYAKRLANGEGGKQEYYEALTRAVGVATASDLMPNIDRAPRELNDWHAALMWFTTWGHKQTRDAMAKVRSVGRAYKTGNRAELNLAIRSLARHASAQTVSAGAVNVLREVIFGSGPDEGLEVSMAQFREAPAKTLAGWAADGAAGALSTALHYGINEDGSFNPVPSMAPVSLLSGVVAALNPSTDDYRFKGKSPLERAQYFFDSGPISRASARIAEWDSLRSLMAPIGLGQYNEHLRAARKVQRAFLEAKGEDQHYSSSDSEFSRNMRMFSDTMLKETSIGQRGEAIYWLQNAMQAAASDAIDSDVENPGPSRVVRSIKARKLFDRIPLAFRGEFVAKYPRYAKELMDHDRLLDSWAASIERMK